MDPDAIQKALDQDANGADFSRERALREALAALRKSHEELKGAQLRLIQSTKFESVGRLAASVAHEVKNPLAIILSGVEYLSEAIPSPTTEVVGVLEEVRSAVIRANGVIRGLLEFSANTDLNPTLEDLNDIVDRSVLLVKHALTRGHVSLIQELAPELPPVMVDRTKIEQLFVNLFLNAVDALPDGGEIRVRTYTEQMREVGRDVGYRQTDRFRVGQTVVVAEVEDNGTGIDSKDLPSLFDPFFTTKAPGKGTGLGLAISNTIIALHGGSIRIANRPEGGVKVTLLFRCTRARGGSNGEREKDSNPDR